MAMNDVIVPATIPAVTLALHREARFVLRITDGGITVINNHVLETDSIPLIVVTAVRLTRHGLREVSVLEIGYQRARPYSRVHKHRNRLRLERRSPDFTLTEQEFWLVYPKIIDCLRAVLDDTQSRWQSTESWFVPGRRLPVERGVEITVRSEDHSLLVALMREHVRFFRVYILRRYAAWINRKLRYSKYNRYQNYGPNVREVVESLQQSTCFRDGTLREVLLGLCHKRMLIESAFRDLYQEQLTTGQQQFPWLESDRRQKPATPLCVRMTLDQPSGRGTHAQGCVRFEIVYDPRARKEWATTAVSDVPF